jgi:hypothetical protein
MVDPDRRTNLVLDQALQAEQRSMMACTAVLVPPLQCSQMVPVVPDLVHKEDLLCQCLMRACAPVQPHQLSTDQVLGPVLPEDLLYQ